MPDPPPFGSVIASGAVIGSGGLFAQTRAAGRRMPVVPVLSGSSDRCVQTIGIDEICGAIVETIAKKAYGRLPIADATGVGLTDFYRGLSMLDRRTPRMLSFPGGVAQFAAKKLASIGLKSPVTLGNLLDTRDLKHVDVAESFRLLNLPAASNYWQSLERLASKEGASDIAAQLAELARLNSL
jgi:hypothetical protein